MHKSTGADEIYPWVLKEVVDVVVKPLSVIFKKSWQSAEVPGDWKKGKITPIFKKRKKEDPRNYRPVSVTFMQGKIVEKLCQGTWKIRR